MPEPIVPSSESIEVPPSADNGNVPVDAPIAPNPELPTPATAAPVEPATPPVEPELFELPDGRKVDGATLTKEWKENFLPDYTRKAQALAAKEIGTDPNITNNKPANPLADPNFVPQTYEELAKVIRESTIQELEQREKAFLDERKAIEDRVTTELNEIKTADPTLNENALFLHATKYGFNNLKAAYQNLKDMGELAKNVKQATAKDIQKRNDPVAGNPSATGSRLNPSHFSTAVDFLRAQQGK